MRRMAPELVDPQIRVLAAADTATRAEAARTASDPRIRAYAVGLLSRSSTLGLDTWHRALADPDARVRRRAAEVAPTAPLPAEPLVPLLTDPDVTVVEAAAWALGEIGDASIASALAAASCGSSRAEPRTKTSRPPRASAASAVAVAIATVSAGESPAGQVR